MHELTRLPLLTDGECVEVAAGVEALRPLWVRRPATGFEFHTLGTATYLDAQRYHERAARTNTALERSFGWLYDRLRRGLADLLGCPVAFEEHAALPGFHIFSPTPGGVIPGGDVHCDVQFHRIAWPNADGIDFSRPLSYTLAVRLPHTGGGLSVWPVTEPEFRVMAAAERERAAAPAAAVYVAYREGEVVCHSGLQLHTSAPSGPGLGPHEVRLTLQGHAFWRGETCCLYW